MQIKDIVRVWVIIPLKINKVGMNGEGYKLSPLNIEFDTEFSEAILRI